MHGLSLLLFILLVRVDQCYSWRPLRSPSRLSFLSPRPVPAVAAISSSRPTLSVSALHSDRGLAPIPSSSLPHWSQGLYFQCTGCGRCCTNEGEVWFSTDEFAALVDRLHLSAEDVLRCYADEVSGGWVKMKERVLPSTEGGEGANKTACVFLSERDGKSCTVYESRPLQCRSYPYWPRLMDNRTAWESEAVLPQIDQASEGRRWSAQQGGCEGVSLSANTDRSNFVTPEKILYSLQSATLYLHRREMEVKEEPQTEAERENTQREERERLIAHVDCIQKVVNAMRSWVRDFVLEHQLCPYAKPAVASKRVKYAVSFETDPEKAFVRIAEEILFLLSVPDTEVETTLIAFPFLLPEFVDFHEFSLHLEDEVVPHYLAQLRSTLQRYESLNKDKTERESEVRDLASSLFAKANAKRKRQRERKRDLVEQEHVSIDKSLDAVQLAFFHPGFAWGRDCEQSSEDNEAAMLALDFEKRAPCPTVNLLRGDKVRRLANELKTQQIAVRNKESLEKAGASALARKMESILRILL